jgi:hypothetical protein
LIRIPGISHPFRCEVKTGPKLDRVRQLYVVLSIAAKLWPKEIRENLRPNASEILKGDDSTETSGMTVALISQTAITLAPRCTGVDQMWPGPRD